MPAGVGDKILLGGKVLPFLIRGDWTGRVGPERYYLSSKVRDNLHK